MFRLRWMWIAFAIGFGSMSWVYWKPSSVQLIYALIGLSMVFIYSKDLITNRVIVLVLSFILGVFRISTLPCNDSYEDHYSVLWVQHISGSQALVVNEQERWLMSFSTAPDQGALIAVWHIPSKPSIVWKGARSIERISERVVAPRRTAKDWVLLQNKRRLKKTIQLDWLNNGGILWALVSGDKKGISVSEKSLMRRTGTSHLLAISGMHIGMLAVFVYGAVKVLLGWSVFLIRGVWCHRIGIVCSIMVSIWYGEQVGWPSSSQRAVWMIAILGCAKLLEVECSIWDIIGISATIILLKEPFLLYDLGFQLSFSAVIGITLFSKFFKWRGQTSLVFTIMTSFTVTVGAIIGTLPIVGWTFQGVAVMGVFANLLAVPILGGIAVPFAMAGVVLSQWHTDLASVFLVLADASIQLTMYLLEPLDSSLFPVAFTDLEALTLGILLVFTFLVRFLWCKFVVLFFVLVLVITSTPVEGIWRTWFLSLNTLTIRFLNVGQGDANVLEWGDGSVWLIDGGPFSFELVPYLRREGIWHIDQLWLSHPHRDHFDGLFNVLRDMSVDSLVIGRYPEVSEDGFFRLIALAHQRGVKVHLAEKNYSALVEIGSSKKDVRLLHPFQWTENARDKTNEESLVLQVCNLGGCVLFTGDIEEDAERKLLSKLAPIDILKVAHHGSKTSTSKSFVQLVKPKHSIISSGQGNRFNHPNLSVLWNLRESVIWRTDTHGTIVARIDSSGLQIDSETFVDKP